MEYICYCGVKYSSFAGMDACQRNNHGNPTPPTIRHKDLIIEVLTKAGDLQGAIIRNIPYTPEYSEIWNANEKLNNVMIELGDLMETEF